MRYRLFTARIYPDRADQVAEYEARMNELIESGYIPFGAPAVQLDNDGASVILQHMMQDEDEEPETKDPDDMG